MKIPSDIEEIAADVTRSADIEDDEAEGFPLYDAIAKAIANERKRCIEICEAEREWGSNIEEVQTRIERGAKARIIPGWNAPSDDS